MLTRLIDVVGGLGFTGLALSAAALAFSETAVGLDLVVPGEAGMLVVGAAADQHAYSPVPLAVAAAVGATVGDTVSYAIGRRWGLALLERWRLTRRLVPKARDAEGWFERRGGAAVFIGRWVGALRAIVPVIAGTARMSFGRFLAWNVLASVTWAGAAVTLGYVLGTSAARQVDRMGFWSYLALLGAVGAWWLVRRWRRRDRPRTASRTDRRSDHLTPAA